MLTRPDPDYQLKSYEGLVRATARRYETEARRRGIEIEDLEQVLRVKIWQAIERFNPERSNLPIRNYVFACMTNRVKDVLRRGLDADLYLEDMVGRDWDESGRDSNQTAMKYLSVSEEQTFEEPDMELPASLNDEERQVAQLIINGYKHPEIAAALEVKLSHVRAVVAAMRLKLGGDLPQPAMKEAA